MRGLGNEPETFGAFYRRHEGAVLRFFMEHLRSPKLACDLTAETFAAALAQAERFDPSRTDEAEWLLALANTQLLRAQRVGAVDDAARTALRLPPIALDDRTLDSVWQLRGPEWSGQRKPRPSGSVVVGGDAARGAVVAVAAGAATADGSSEPRSGATLPAVESALVAAAGQRHGRRRRRRRLVIGARVAVALVTVTWVVGAAVVPDRSESLPETTWLPFVTEYASGEFPRFWFVAQAPQAPGARREVVALTTFETGVATDPECGALAIMGRNDAVVYVLAGRAAPDVTGCAPGASVIRKPLPRGEALIVLGPDAHEDTRAEAEEILERIEIARAWSGVLLERVQARQRSAAGRHQEPAVVQPADVDAREPEPFDELAEARLRARVVAGVEHELGPAASAAMKRANSVLNALTTWAPGASDATYSLLVSSPRSSTCIGE